MSAFSFISENSTEESSGFSFLQAEDTVRLEQPEGNTFGNDEAEIKLEKQAAAKAVKKKKKFTRVGVGRDEEEEHYNSKIQSKNIEITETGEMSRGPIALEQSFTENESNIVSHSDLHVPQIPPPVPPYLNVDNLELEKLEPTHESPMQFLEENKLEIIIEDHLACQNELVSLEIGSQKNTAEDGGGLPLSDTPSKEEILPDTNKTPEKEEEDKTDGTYSLQQIANFVGEDLKKRLRSHQDSAIPLESILISVKCLKDTVKAHDNVFAEIIKSQQKIDLLVLTVSQLEQRQANYAMVEQFDLAEELNTEIENAKVSIDKQSVHHAELLSAFHQLTGAYLNAKVELVKEFSGVKNVVDSNFISTKVSIEEMKEKLESFRTEEEKKIFNEHKRVELEKSHYQRELDIIGNETTIVEDAIKVEVGDVLAKKEDIEDKVRKVDDEINQLEKELAKKKEEKATLDGLLRRVNSTIQETRKKYERQLQRLHDRKVHLEQGLEECTNEEVAIGSQRTALEEVLADINKDIQRVEEVLNDRVKAGEFALSVHDNFTRYLPCEGKSSQETTELKLFDYTIALEVKSDKVRSKLRSLTTDELQDIDKYVNLTEQTHKSELEITNIRNSVDEMKRIQEQHDIELQFLKDSLNKLESEKKSFASNKKFKEAALVAKEIKDLSIKREELERNVQELKTIISSEEEQLISKESKLLHLKKLSATLINTVQSRFRALLISKAKEILKVRNELAKFLLSTNSGDSTVSEISSIGKYLLEKEEEVLKALAKFVLNDDFVITENLLFDEVSSDEVNCFQNDKREEILPTHVETDDNDGSLENTVQVDNTTDPLVEKLEEDASESKEQLLERIINLENQINVAVEEEDYEKAGELQELVDKLKLIVDNK